MLDSDGDFVVDPIDNCVTVQNTDQGDQDHDLIGTACDNCPSTPNQSQKYTTNATTFVNGQQVPVGDACNCALPGVTTGYSGGACPAAPPSTPALPPAGIVGLTGLLLLGGLGRLGRGRRGKDRGVRSL